MRLTWIATGDDFRGFDDNEDIDEHEYLERNMSGNNHQQQQEKDTNKKNENVFLRIERVQNPVGGSCRPKPKEQPINHDTKVEKVMIVGMIRKKKF